MDRERWVASCRSTLSAALDCERGSRGRCDASSRETSLCVIARLMKWYIVAKERNLCIERTVLASRTHQSACAQVNALGTSKNEHEVIIYTPRKDEITWQSTKQVNTMEICRSSRLVAVIVPLNFRFSRDRTRTRASFFPHDNALMILLSAICGRKNKYIRSVST